MFAYLVTSWLVIDGPSNTSTLFVCLGIDLTCTFTHSSFLTLASISLEIYGYSIVLRRHSKKQGRRQIGPLQISQSPKRLQKVYGNRLVFALILRIQSNIRIFRD